MDLSEKTYLKGVFLGALDRMEKAREKYPQPNFVALKVAEEAGEVIQAAVHYSETGRRYEGIRTADDLYDECIDLIAMTMRLMIEGDQKNGVPSIFEADKFSWTDEDE